MLFAVKYRISKQDALLLQQILRHELHSSGEDLRALTLSQLEHYFKFQLRRYQTFNERGLHVFRDDNQ